MIYIIRTALFMTILLTLITGGIYPLYASLIAKLFPYQATGSLLVKGEKTIGSELLAQKFTSAKYFKARPSAVDYNASSSGASNLAHSNKQLVQRINDETEKYKALGKKVTPDMVTTSASGLDPHISPAAAKTQAEAIATARNMKKETLLKLIDENTEKSFIGIFGEKRVNVMKLNLLLDEMQK